MAGMGRAPCIFCSFLFLCCNACSCVPSGMDSRNPDEVSLCVRCCLCQVHGHSDVSDLTLSLLFHRRTKWGGTSSMWQSCCRDTMSL